LDGRFDFAIASSNDDSINRQNRLEYRSADETPERHAHHTTL
jgi:hypothetical protein